MAVAATLDEVPISLSSQRDWGAKKPTKTHQSQVGLG